MATKKCYAACLGDCDGPSREHPVTRSLFGDGVVEFAGDFPWLGNSLDIDSMVAKVLCQKHNSQLSVLDSEIHAFGEAIKKAWTGAKAQIRLNGYLLERYLLKFFAGVAASGWIKGAKSLPHEQVVRTIFGLEKLPPNVALYGISVEGTQSTNKLSFSFDFLYSPHQDGSFGVIVAIHGAPLLLSICLRNPELELHSRGSAPICGYNMGRSALHRHPDHIRLSGSNGSEIIIRLDWSADAFKKAYALGSRAPKKVGRQKTG